MTHHELNNDLKVTKKPTLEPSHWNGETIGELLNKLSSRVENAKELLRNPEENSDDYGFQLGIAGDLMHALRHDRKVSIQHIYYNDWIELDGPVHTLAETLTETERTILQGTAIDDFELALQYALIKAHDQKKQEEKNQ